MTSVTEVMVRLCLAVVLGTLLGLDRLRVEPAAGPRTHALVALGSALLLIVSSKGFMRVIGLPHVVLDPSRVAAQVVSGIGFLGAGVILLRRETETIRNLTTAASIWVVAAIGLAVGAGLYVGAVASTVLALLILRGVKRLEQTQKSLMRRYTLTLRLDSGADGAAEIERRAVQAGARCRYRRLQLNNKQGYDEYELEVSRISAPDLMALTRECRNVPGLLDLLMR
ncbi:MgtC/SapB family protein [Deinococcus sp. D7000]|nr:MgtC/SapB family protein [Deinococcus sp. D7000]